MSDNDETCGRCKMHEGLFRHGVNLQDNADHVGMEFVATNVRCKFSAGYASELRSRSLEPGQYYYVEVGIASQRADAPVPQPPRTSPPELAKLPKVSCPACAGLGGTSGGGATWNCGQCAGTGQVASVALPTHEAVDHPSHYAGGGIEVIDVIEAWGLGFCAGNVVKYVGRHAHKGTPLEDLKKAQWYLNRLIESMEKTDEQS